MKVKGNPCNITIMILNHESLAPSPPQQLELAKHQDMHTIATICQNLFDTHPHPNGPPTTNHKPHQQQSYETIAKTPSHILIFTP